MTLVLTKTSSFEKWTLIPVAFNGDTSPLDYPVTKDRNRKTTRFSFQSTQAEYHFEATSSRLED